MENVTVRHKAMRLFLSGVLVLAAASCAPRTAAPPEGAAKPTLSIEEQDKKSQEAYANILEMTAWVERHTILPQMEEKYEQLIEDYPDSYFAEESYYRLMKMYMYDYSPPDVDKAEEWYREYFRHFKNPRLKNLFNDTVVRFYFQFQHWDRLLSFLDPVIRQYYEGKRTDGPLYLLFYSIAKQKRGAIEEARNGFKTIIERFDGSHEATVAKDMLNKLDNPESGQ
jgi:hypothetical protein